MSVACYPETSSGSRVFSDDTFLHTNLPCTPSFPRWLCASHKKRARIAAGPFLFPKTGFLELAAQRDAIGPRFGKELREDLATAWILRIHKWC